jgi:hypothetical protein
MTTKTKAIKHYEKMIAWAKKQRPRKRVDIFFMGNSISQIWISTYCSYCLVYLGCVLQKTGKKCPLYEANAWDVCCNELWRKMDKAKTWGTWVKRAEKVLEYIKEHG